MKHSKKSPTHRSLAALVLSLLCWSTLGAQDKPAQERPKEASSTNEVRIGPGDVLRVDVWKEPEVTGDVQVRGDCRITMPLIKDQDVCGLTPAEIAKMLTEKLSKFITSPDVTVVVKQIVSRRIYLVGQVRRPGPMLMLTTMTVAQALNEAGGLSEYANPKKVMVVRTRGGKTERWTFNYKDYLNGKDSQNNIDLEPGDTIIAK